MSRTVLPYASPTRTRRIVGLAATLTIASLAIPSGPGGYAWQVVLAVVFGVAAVVLCRAGFGWIRRGVDGYDLRRINGGLRRVAGAGIVAAVVAGVAVLVVDRPAVVDRPLHLVALVSGRLRPAPSPSCSW